MLRLIQISDCHLQADPTARSRAGFPLRQLEAVIRAVQAERPDLVLVTGDVSQDGTAASYALAQQALSSLGCPWFWLAGNHDDPAQMRDLRELHEAIDLGGWRLLTLDTVVSGQAYGEAGEERLAALAERLAEDERPTLLAMHHPPGPGFGLARSDRAAGSGAAVADAGGLSTAQDPAVWPRAPGLCAAADD